ncbi:hypothetical protein D918_01305 [Trichuris suis]|nr:hypothetical protein D918_01305 [Trichuris suis]
MFFLVGHVTVCYLEADVFASGQRLTDALIKRPIVVVVGKNHKWLSKTIV